MIIGIDMGGTHIDGVIIDNGKIIKTIKNPTDRKDIFNSIWGTLKELFNGCDKNEISRINLSTTVSTNAIVENNISEVGTILQAGPGMTYDFSDIGENVEYISGYMDHRGKMVKGLDEKEIKKIKESFISKDIDSLSIVTKFSTRNPSYEKLIGEELEDKFKNTTLGHSMSGKLNFPRRVRTAYLNGAVHNIFEDFAKNIKNALKEENIDVPIFILKADGGTMDLDKAIDIPVETILSGPAASFMGMNALLKNDDDAILLDIGGTTTDIFFLIDGIPVFEPMGIEIDGFKTLVRAIFSKSVGLGGDSFVRLENKEIKIGPKRKDNPLAFGGKYVTPTDAMVVLGYLDEGNRDESIKGILKILEDEDMDISLEDFSKKILYKFIDDIYKEINLLLKEINSKPVYTVEELLKGKKLEPKVINIIGGPAKVFSEIMKERKNINVVYPENYKIANAVGAALAKPTIEINMLADTDRKILTVPEANIYEPISSRYTLEDAEERALSIVKDSYIDLGGIEENIEAEIIESSSFNMVKGFLGSSKNIRVRAQVKPGLIYELRGDGNES